MGKIAFIGLGNLGAAMAHRLRECGVSIIGWDQDPRAVREFAETGGEVAETLEACLTGVDGVGLAVFDITGVEEVVKVAVNLLPKGAYIMNHATVSPPDQKRVSDFAAEHGVVCVDVMVSGGPQAALEGRKTFMCGGIDAAPSGWAPYFEAVSGNGSCYFCGPPGSGCAAKLANNHMLFINNTAALEAIKYATHFGVSEQTAIDIARKSTGQSWVTDQWDFMGSIIQGRMERYGPLDVHFLLKDLNITVDSAKKAGFNAELAEASLELMPEYYTARFAAKGIQ